MSVKKTGSKQLQKIAAKVLNGTATPAEKEFLDEYYNFFDQPDNAGELTEDEMGNIHQDITNRLHLTTTGATVKKINVLKTLGIAASIILTFGAGAIIYTLLNKSPKQQIALQPVKAKPIVHGGNKATLTLADGSKIALDDHTSGALATQSGVKISKTAEGQLVYKSDVVADAGTVAPANQFNVMETPRGGIYQVYLPDGTKVWLNSESKLKYPVAFSGADRTVELTGEAYFEVAHNAQKPFKVLSDNQVIEVLGTHFNVNAYPDDVSIKTTLLQGSVKVTATSSGVSKTIVPGQQAVLRLKGIQLHNVDTDNAIAWKTGLFRFDNESISTIMKKISRWYDVDVTYRDYMGDMRFGGTVSRFTDINKVLSKLALTNTIHFKIEGRRIIVMK